MVAELFAATMGGAESEPRHRMRNVQACFPRVLIAGDVEDPIPECSLAARTIVDFDAH